MRPIPKGKKEQKQIELELGKGSEYLMLIEAKKKELAEIDERLGIANE